MAIYSKQLTSALKIAFELFIMVFFVFIESIKIYNYSGLENTKKSFKKKR